jgi:hypothetical protein
VGAASLLDKQIERVDALEASYNDVKRKIVGIEAAHATGDEMYGEFMDRFETSLKNLTATVNGIKADLDGYKNAMMAEQYQLSTRVRNLESGVTEMRSSSLMMVTAKPQKESPIPPKVLPPNGAYKPPVEASALQGQLDELKSAHLGFQQAIDDLRNFRDGTNMGLRALDTRMNNISTEHVCRQIIGQLQLVYPNLAHAESQLLQFKSRIDNIEVTLKNQNESIGFLTVGAQEQTDHFLQYKTFIKGLIDNSQSEYSTRLRAWEANAKEEMSKLYGQNTGIRQELTDQIVATSKESNNQIEIASTALHQKIDLVYEDLHKQIATSQDLQKQIETSSKDLQKQIEYIESIIIFDEGDGKEETMKERMNVLAQNYGGLLGDVDALDDQIRRLKRANAARSSGPRAGSAGSVATGAEQTGDKRSTPTSPSSVCASDRRPPKRKKNGAALGAFLSDNE